jgi:hypothetical protein
LVWSAFTLWTVRKLWRKPKDPKLTKYDVAAKFFCVPMAISTAAILPAILIFPGIPYWVESLVFGLIAFPESLWCGYAMSREFQAMDERKR